MKVVRVEITIHPDFPRRPFAYVFQADALCAEAFALGPRRYYQICAETMIERYQPVPRGWEIVWDNWVETPDEVRAHASVRQRRAASDASEGATPAAGRE